MNSELRARIATLLGWTEAEVTSFSLPALRELVRPTSKKLTHELDLLIQGGVIVKPRNRAVEERRCGYVVKSTSDQMWSGHGPGDPDNPTLGREVVSNEERAHVFASREEAEAEAATYGSAGSNSAGRNTPGARVFKVSWPSSDADGEADDADDAKKMVDELPRDQKTRDGRRAVWLTDGDIALLLALIRALEIENCGRIVRALEPFDQTTNVEGYL